MHEFKASEPVTIRLPLPDLADGDVQYQETPTHALVIESRGFTPADGAKANFEFLLPGDTEVQPGSQIIWRDSIYDIAAIKTCRDLDGQIRAHRCTVC